MTFCLTDVRCRVFLRSVYTLGESSDSVPVEFRTAPHDVEADHRSDDSRTQDPSTDSQTRSPSDGSLENRGTSGTSPSKDPSSHSSDSKEQFGVSAQTTGSSATSQSKDSCQEKGPSGDTFTAKAAPSTDSATPQCPNSIPVQSAPASVVKCPEGKQIFPAEIDSRPIARNSSLGQATEVLDQPLRGCCQPVGPGLIAASGSNRSKSVLTADCDLRFVPKPPPDEVVTQRRSSMTRRGSFRKRSKSESLQYVETETSGDAGASAAADLVPMCSNKTCVAAILPVSSLSPRLKRSSSFTMVRVNFFSTCSLLLLLLLLLLLRVLI